jgi:hypothetical protein
LIDAPIEKPALCHHFLELRIIASDEWAQTGMIAAAIRESSIRNHAALQQLVPIHTRTEKEMKKIATGTVTALLIAATTSLAMAQGYQSPRNNDSGGYGATSQSYSVNPNYYDSYDGNNYGARSQQYDVGPGSSNAGIEQER